MPSSNNIPEEKKEFHIEQLEEWKSIISENLPHLSKPQVTVLALWSFGMAVIKTCALTSVSFFMSLLLDEKEYTMKQRLREWYCDREDKKGQKKGEKRTDVEVSSCFVFLLKWIIKHCSGCHKSFSLFHGSGSICGVSGMCYSCSVDYS